MLFSLGDDRLARSARMLVEQGFRSNRSIVMRERLARFASVSTLVVAVFLVPCARAQQNTGREAGDQRSNASMNETIRGTVAGVTTEGEVFFNHQTNSAVKAEATFLTVVGSPIHSEARDRDHAAAAVGNEKQHAGSGGRRHNVYVVWMTPKTKVCEATNESGASQNARSESSKKECALDRLEVGDHVEVQFTPQDESAAHSNIHQSEQMRSKHGRHRTHVGYATAITIMPSKDHDQSGPARNARSSETPK
jgi:phosphatidate phosphatase PAH1